jgi:phosphate transport system protein
MPQHLTRDLGLLKQEILYMGALVEEATRKALQGLTERHPEAAREVIAGDHRVDRQELEITEMSIKMLALHQPVARDLRFIVSALTVNNDLERIGDLAVNIAERALALQALEQVPIPGELHQLAERVRGMVRDSLNALVSTDPVLARRVIRQDDEADRMHADMFRRLSAAIHENPARTDQMIHILSCSRNLERMADHATNIAEDVVFLVEGEIIKHPEAGSVGGRGE